MRSNISMFPFHRIDFGTQRHVRAFVSISTVAVDVLAPNVTFDAIVLRLINKHYLIFSTGDGNNRVVFLAANYQSSWGTYSIAEKYC